MEETQKSLLLRYWGDINNEVVENYLKNVVRMDYNETQARGYVDGTVVYYPIYLKQFNSVIKITDIQPEDGSAPYREIILEILKEGEKPRLRIVYSTTANTSIFMLKMLSSSSFSFYKTSKTIYLSDEGMVDVRYGEPVAGITVDFVAETHSAFGYYDSSYDFIKGLKYSDEQSMEEIDWKEFIKESIENNEAFARFAEKFKLIERAEEDLATNLRSIVLGFEHPKTLPFILDDRFFKFIKDEGDDWDGYFETSQVDYYNHLYNDSIKEGDTIWQMLGIKEELVPFFEHRLNVPDYKKFYNNYGMIRNFIMLSQVLTHVEYWNELRGPADIEDAISILEESGHPLFVNATTGKFLYLLRRGYKIHELLEYLQEIDSQQALAVKEGLDKLYKTVFYQEILSGEFHKRKPQYLIIEHMVSQRAFNNMLDATRDGVFADSKDEILCFNKESISKIGNRRNELVKEGDDFEIVNMSPEHITRDLLTEIEEGNDILLYKKKRGKLYVPITLTGDVIISIGKKLDKKHLGNIYAWAEENHLIVKLTPIHKEK